MSDALGGDLFKLELKWSLLDDRLVDVLIAPCVASDPFQIN